MSEPIRKNPISSRETWGDSEFRQPAGTYIANCSDLYPACRKEAL